MSKKHFRNESLGNMKESTPKSESKGRVPVEFVAKKRKFPDSRCSQNSDSIFNEKTSNLNPSNRMLNTKLKDRVTINKKKNPQKTGIETDTSKNRQLRPKNSAESMVPENLFKSNMIRENLGKFKKKIAEIQEELLKIKKKRETLSEREKALKKKKQKVIKKAEEFKIPVEIFGCLLDDSDTSETNYEHGMKSRPFLENIYNIMPGGNPAAKYHCEDHLEHNAIQNLSNIFKKNSFQ